MSHMQKQTRAQHSATQTGLNMSEGAWGHRSPTALCLLHPVLLCTPASVNLGVSMPCQRAQVLGGMAEPPRVGRRVTANDRETMRVWGMQTDSM